MNVQRELDRKITLAQTIIERLDNGDRLSEVLSQVRSLMVMSEDTFLVAFVDILIHGLSNIPYQPPPFKDPVYKEAGLFHMRLCSMEDVSKLDINEIVRKFGRNSLPEKSFSTIGSVYEMENRAPPLEPVLGDSYDLLNTKLQLQTLDTRTKSILQSLRAYIYDKVNAKLLECIREKDRIELLGVEYRFITDKLNTLESPVGDELLAAIDNLSSNNPAKWNATALVCRNVELKLAKILWQGKNQDYVLSNGDTIKISGGNEKNILLAYIDVHCKKFPVDEQAEFKEMSQLVHSIYSVGSKGKNNVRHKEAQQIVVDTFHFVDLLNTATRLLPINEL
ncbi:hypothetical protein ACFLTT_01325 [Chloroflexota bacterium]